MSLRGFLGLGLVLCLAFVLGLYWKQSAIERVMRDGYDATGKITSAEITSRRFPIVFDAGWPRFVDEDLSIGLRWTGGDGVDRIRRGIAVSGAFAARITQGDQVRLLTVPIRVVDDDSSDPVLIEDVSDRLRHIQFMSNFAQVGAALFALALAVLIGWQKWSARNGGPGKPAIGSEPPRAFPIRLALITLLILPFGAYMLVDSYLQQRAAQEMLDHGDEVVADLTRAFSEVRKPGEAPSYLVELAWTDRNGQRRLYGPTHISAAFWRQITRNNVQTVSQTKIRYLDGKPGNRPLIMGDTAERQFQDNVGVKSGAGFLVIGLIFAGLTVFRLRGPRIA
jgi:hypothetical protein